MLPTTGVATTWGVSSSIRSGMVREEGPSQMLHGGRGTQLLCFCMNGDVLTKPMSWRARSLERFQVSIDVLKDDKI